MHIERMSRSLREVVEEYLTKNDNGRAQLCVAIGRTEATLSRWLKNGVPTTNHAFKLAVACGVEEQEALRIAREEAPVAAREPA